MTQVVTPEEMAALLEGLREAEAYLDSERCVSAKIISPGRSFPESLGYKIQRLIKLVAGEPWDKETSLL